MHDIASPGLSEEMAQSDFQRFLTPPYQKLSRFDMKRFTELKADTLLELGEIFDGLKKLKTDLMIVRISSGAGGIVSGLLTVGGLVALPYTFGASLGLSIAGASVGLATVGTGAGGQIVVQKMEEKILEAAKEKCEELIKMLSQLENLCKEAADAYNNGVNGIILESENSPQAQAQQHRLQLAGAVDLETYARRGLMVAGNGVKSLDLAIDGRVLTAGVRIGRRVLIPIAAVGAAAAIGVGIFDIVKGALSKDEFSEAMQQLQEFMKELERICAENESNYSACVANYNQVFNPNEQTAADDA